MGPTWDNGSKLEEIRIGPIGWIRALMRGLVLGAVVFGGLVILLSVRLIERPICGVKRPVTPYITQFVCRLAFVILGIRHRVRGTPMREQGAVVANHSSWLDIFALNAAKRVYFVSKSEVAQWPGIGWLARATGTVFIERDPRKAKAQSAVFEERLLAGHKLLFFPEGTSTDGMTILPFKTSLFAAFLTPELRPRLYVQAVTLNYQAPKSQDARYYGWWGDMEFGPHLLKTLAGGSTGMVEVIYHPPRKVSAFENRKTLAAQLEQDVRAGHRTS